MKTLPELFVSLLIMTGLYLTIGAVFLHIAMVLTKELLKQRDCQIGLAGIPMELQIEGKTSISETALTRSGCAIPIVRLPSHNESPTQNTIPDCETLNYQSCIDNYPRCWWANGIIHNNNDEFYGDDELKCHTDTYSLDDSGSMCREECTTDSCTDTVYTCYEGTDQ